MVPYERFTDPAKAALACAQEQAQAAAARFIGTEHLLLGLLLTGDGMAAEVLADLGVDLDAALSAIEVVSGRTHAPGTGPATPTPQVRRVIELAFEEARDERSARVATEHLLVGVLRQGEGTGARALVHLGAPLERVRATITELVREGAADADTERVALPPLGPTTSAATDALIDLARDDTRGEGPGSLEPENVLRALLRSDGFTAGVLRSLGVDPAEALRRAGPPEELRGLWERVREARRELSAATGAAEVRAARARYREARARYRRGHEAWRSDLG